MSPEGINIVCSRQKEKHVNRQKSLQNYEKKDKRSKFEHKFRQFPFETQPPLH